MVKGLLVIVGVLIFGFSAAKEATEESILRKRSCEQCKVDLGSSAGREMNKKGSSERCVCAEQETVIRRKVRSVDDGNITAANDGNKSDSETKGKNWITHRDCREYIKRKKQEYNGIRPKVETGDVNIDAMNATITKHGAHSMANVTWNPPDKNVDALENYLIYYSGASIPYFFCEEIPKNKTFKVINGSSNDWKYPEALDVLVVALPSSKLFAPALTARTFFQGRDIPEVPPYPKRSPTIKDKESTPGLTIILVATVLSCIVCALLGWIYRRRQRSQSIEEFETVQVKATKPQNTDKYFASYLPENEKFSNEVATIAYKLGTMGYKIVFDQVDSVHMNEIGFNMWVDKQILEAKKYIVFCSPGYVRLWQSLATSAVDNKLSHVNKEDLVRVRYEIKRISDIYSENCSTSRIVCVKMDPKMTTKQLPPWMNHNMLQWPEQKEDVIRRLNDQAAMVMHM